MSNDLAGTLADRLRANVPPEALVLPTSAEYEVARLVYNRMHDDRPAAIVRSLDPDVLRAAISIAAELGVGIAARGGGHHIGGFSTIDGGLVIDFSVFRGVDFNAATGLVKVQPGTRLGDLDTYLATHGRCVPSGTVSDTGITGLTLGGGIGWLVAEHGLTCDHLQTARLLLADGRIITASADEHSNLFSALRGGGMGAFGLILELTFRTLPMPKVVAGSVSFPLQDAEEKLRALHEFMAAETPRTMTIAPTLVFHQGVPRLSIDLCIIAEHDHNLAMMQTLLGGDWSDVVERSYPQWQSNFDSAFMPPMRGYWKSVHFDNLDVIVKSLVEAIEDAPTPACSVLLEYFNVKTLRNTGSGSCYPLRESQVGVLLSARWAEPQADAKHVRWARSWAETLRQSGQSKAYSNYSEASDTQMSTTYDRAQIDVFTQLENIYDPGRIFARGHRAVALAAVTQS